MSKTKITLEDEQKIFASLLIISKRIDTLLERELKEFDVTTKQWFLSVIIHNMFSKPPTMNEAANEMGSSHQNVKQVALKLEHKGLLKLEKDKKDARITRLKMTEQSYVLWEKIRPKGTKFIETVFNDIKKDDLEKAKVVLQKMLSNLIEMEKN